MVRIANPIVLIEGSSKEESLIRHAMIEANLDRPAVLRRTAEEALGYLAMAQEDNVSATHPLPGLVILSLKPARQDGLEVINWLRSQPKLADTAVVILTPTGDQTAWKRLFKSKVERILLKPVAPEQLKQAVEEHYRSVAV